MLKILFGWTKKTASSENNENARLAIDQATNYCPGCGDEYRATIKRCVSCDISLISAEEKLEKLRLKERAFNGRSMYITAQDQRTVIRIGKLRDLKQLQILLAKERVPTIISSESASCGKG